MALAISNASAATTIHTQKVSSVDIAFFLLPKSEVVWLSNDTLVEEAVASFAALRRHA